MYHLNDENWMWLLKDRVKKIYKKKSGHTSYNSTSWSIKYVFWLRKTKSICKKDKLSLCIHYKEIKHKLSLCTHYKEMMKISCIQNLKVERIMIGLEREDFTNLYGYKTFIYILFINRPNPLVVSKKKKKTHCRESKEKPISAETVRQVHWDTFDLDRCEDRRFHQWYREVR